MQWDASKNAGFSKGDNTWLPVNPNYLSINVQKEDAEGDSILNFYRSIIELRKKEEPLSFGDFEPLKTNGKILAFFRSYKGEMLFILLNLSKKTVHLPKSIRVLNGEVLLSNYEGAGLTFKKKLRPYEAIVAKLS